MHNAVDYIERLVENGKSLADAKAHARQRYGVTAAQLDQVCELAALEARERLLVLGDTPPTTLAHYVETLATLRSRCAEDRRSTYTVALGQLRACGLISERAWREAIERPRERVR